jgi:PAS domain S-box-containing protein
MDERGVPYEYLSVRTDITRRMQAEEDLAKQQHLMTMLLRSMEQGYWFIDTQGITREVNPEMCRILGRSEADIVGRNIFAFVDEANARIFRDQMARRARNEKGSYEVELLRPDGSNIAGSICATPIYDTNGERIGSVGMWSDISERRKQEQERETLKNAALVANRAKSEFLASMSHELRTPLNAILGFGHLLQTDPELSADAMENVVEIARAGGHLLALVDDLIDLARIEAGKLDLFMEPVPARPVLVEALGLMKPLAEKAGIRLVDAIELDESLAVQVDLTRFRQVILNFLSNAIKYNKPQGQVDLTCQTLPGRLRVSVSDTGRGIPADKQWRIFNPFDRIGEERGNIQGTGIGLVISKRIVEAMEGRIGFESVEDEGSLFWVEFPLASSAVAPESSAPRGGAAASGTGPGGCGPREVLYVEDDPTNAQLLGKCFAKRGDLTLTLAASAEAGLALARETLPALILMDINLPGMDGFQALQVLKADARTASIPVIAVSANAMQGDRDRGQTAGFLHYLTKPIQVPDLLMLIDKALGASPS